MKESVPAAVVPEAVRYDQSQNRHVDLGTVLERLVLAHTQSLNTRRSSHGETNTGCSLEGASGWVGSGLIVVM